jgi:hypothetical protein
MVEWLERVFPRLRGTAYVVTSPPTEGYNCVAWAAGFTDRWWWPVGPGPCVYWPSGIARTETIEAVRDAFALLGYAPCADEQHESGYEKVALFADAGGIPTHAARQLPTGRWTSKLGQGDDIEHELRALEGAVYGLVALVLRRLLPPAEPRPTL